jgi:hypothetical protein
MSQEPTPKTSVPQHPASRETESQDLRLARIVLEDTQARHQQITIDLVFEGDQIRRGNEYYGVWRDHNEDSICPFVMNANGEMDFGTGYSGDDRFYELDVLNSRIGLGQQVALQSDQYETQMKIVGVTQLI